LKFLEYLNGSDFEKQGLQQQDAVLGEPVVSMLSFQRMPPVMYGNMVPTVPPSVGGMPYGQQPAYAPVMMPPPSVAVDTSSRAPSSDQKREEVANMQQQQRGWSSGSKRRMKTPEEKRAQEERVKQRRRESAQRSRQRKSAYMKNLECENHALKLENERLRKALAQQLNTKSLDGSASSATTSMDVVRSDAEQDGLVDNKSNVTYHHLQKEKANNTAAEILGITV